MTQQTYIMLTAAEGKILTNGETFGRIVLLGNGDVPENWREVDDAEYTAYLEAEEAKAATAGDPPVENGDGIVHGDSTVAGGTPEPTEAEEESDGT